MRASRFRWPLLGAALLALGSGCAPETSTTQVSSAELHPPKLRSFLVIGLGPGGGGRHQLEDKLCAGLSTRGLVARPSYELFPEAVPGQEAARDAARMAGIDGIVTTRVTRVEMKKRYVPPTETYFAGFEHDSYTRSDPGYYVSDELAELDTSVFGVTDGKKLWAATTRTVNPSPTQGFARSYAENVVTAMQNAGLVPSDK